MLVIFALVALLLRSFRLFLLAPPPLGERRHGEQVQREAERRRHPHAEHHHAQRRGKGEPTRR
jgi:hypothetical protein